MNWLSPTRTHTTIHPDDKLFNNITYISLKITTELHKALRHRLTYTRIIADITRGQQLHYAPGVSTVNQMSSMVLANYYTPNSRPLCENTEIIKTKRA